MDRENYSCHSLHSSNMEGRKPRPSDLAWMNFLLKLTTGSLYTPHYQMVLGPCCFKNNTVTYRCRFWNLKRPTRYNFFWPEKIRSIKKLPRTPAHARSSLHLEFHSHPCTIWRSGRSKYLSNNWNLGERSFLNCHLCPVPNFPQNIFLPFTVPQSLPIHHYHDHYQLKVWSALAKCIWLCGKRSLSIQEKQCLSVVFFQF